MRSPEALQGRHPAGRNRTSEQWSRRTLRSDGRKTAGLRDVLSKRIRACVHAILHEINRMILLLCSIWRWRTPEVAVMVSASLIILFQSSRTYAGYQRTRTRRQYSRTLPRKDACVRSTERTGSSRTSAAVADGVDAQSPAGALQEKTLKHEAGSTGRTVTLLRTLDSLRNDELRALCGNCGSVRSQSVSVFSFGRPLARCTERGRLDPEDRPPSGKPGGQLLGALVKMLPGNV